MFAWFSTYDLAATFDRVVTTPRVQSGRSTQSSGVRDIVVLDPAGNVVASRRDRTLNAETFLATVVPAGNATGAEVPAEVVDALDDGKRPKVTISIKWPHVA